LNGLLPPRLRVSVQEEFAYAFLINGGVGFSSKHTWNVKVPLKVRIHMWIFIKGRLNTLDMLAHKNIAQGGACILCGIESESITHLFLHCGHTRDIWHNWKMHLIYIIVPQMLLTCGQVGETWVRHDFSIEWDLSVMAVCWIVWNERNNRIFSQKYRSSCVLSDAIDSFIFFLVSYLAPATMEDICQE